MKLNIYVSFPQQFLENVLQVNQQALTKLSKKVNMSILNLMMDMFSCQSKASIWHLYYWRQHEFVILKTSGASPYTILNVLIDFWIIAFPTIFSPPAFCPFWLSQKECQISPIKLFQYIVLNVFHCVDYTGGSWNMCLMAKATGYFTLFFILEPQWTEALQIR